MLDWSAKWCLTPVCHRLVLESSEASVLTSDRADQQCECHAQSPWIHVRICRSGIRLSQNRPVMCVPNGDVPGVRDTPKPCEDQMKYGIAVRNMGPQSTAKTLRAC